MDLFPARIALQIDRMVLDINRRVGPRHGRVLAAIATELGLDSLKLIPHFADFWLHGPLPPEIAEARMPYASALTVTSRMASFIQLGLVMETPKGLAATDRFRPLLVAAIAAREDVVVRAWTASTPEIDELIERVIESVPESHTVAVAHRDLTPASEPLLRFYDRLVTLRYVRQHDHLEAWRAADMTAGEMGVLTPLWHGESPADNTGWLALEQRGLVTEGKLSERGRRLRERIEADTNRRSASIWSTLGVDERERLIDALTEMPDDISSLR